MRVRFKLPAIRVPVQRTFAGTAAEVPALRQWVAGHAEDGPEVLDVLLVATELATNAILHTASGLPGRTFTASLRISIRDIRVSITDAGSRELPGPPQRDLMDGDGNGLVIVRSLARKVTVEGSGRGTRVTAWVARPGPQTRPAAEITRSHAAPGC
jgi:serine/threonine-protein kinase RsbW